MPEAAVVVVAEVAAVVAEEVVFAAVAFAAAVSVAAGFVAVAVAGDGVATQDRAAITAIAGVGWFARTIKLALKYPNPSPKKTRPMGIIERVRLGGHSALPGDR